MNKLKHTWNYIVQNYHTTLHVRMFGEFLTSLTGSMLAPFLLLYLYERLDGSVLLPLIIVGLQPLAEIVVTIAGGSITDRYGRKLIIMFALFLQIGAMTGFMLADSVWLFAFLYILNGIGHSLYIPAERAQIADIVPDEKRAEVYGVLNTLGYIGQGLGPVLGLLVFVLEPALVFGLQACSLLIYLLVFWKTTHETAPLNHLDEPLAIVVDQDSYTDLSIDKSRSVFNRTKQFVFLHQHVILLMLCTLPISFFYSQTETTFRIHAQAIFTDHLSVIAILATVKACLSVGLQVWLIKKTEHMSLITIMLITCLCYTMTSLLYGFSSVLWPLLVAQLTMTIGESLGLTRLHQYVAGIAPVTNRGLYFSIHGTHWDISRSIGPYLGGIVFIQTSGAVLFTIVSLLLVVSYLSFRCLLTRHLRVAN